ncbi:MAG: helix-turn-helix domain-containing protein [Candidatus Peribacteraceae bacterium]|nr:helix-turn-helix domain-containing protein [Candidatus Peribacteraceae bacterium]
MNSSLPSGIEHSLREAGFSATELLVLRHLVESETLTVRELANKTGKSTGVLDQSVKKLMGKRIVERSIINGQPRYGIRSLDTIRRWMHQDMEQKQASMERQHQSFQQFLSTLKVDRDRPDMEYFHGPDGMEQAYRKLLESGGEFLTISPILTTAEDDPLRACRVSCFRKRQYRKIFQRVIAPDTTLARRFQSRDHFEYRKTLLIPPAEFPLSFEKTTVGSTVACINVQELSACFIRYPELAQAERAAFEQTWSRYSAPPVHSQTAQPPQAATGIIPAKTRILSSFREFFLSKKSIGALIVFGILSGALTTGLALNARTMNLERMRGTVMAIATAGAVHFEADDIAVVQRPEDISNPAYAKLIATLNLIRRSHPDIKYAYLMRKTDDPATLAFVADADSLYPTQKRDLNADGIIDSADALSAPGDLYNISTVPEMAEGFVRPFADHSPSSDQWGTFISGAAPVKDATGTTVALLGVDMPASEMDKLALRSFIPLIIFVCGFLLFTLVRFAAVNRSLVQECWRIMQRNMAKIFLWMGIPILCALLMFFGFRQYTHHILIEQTGKRLVAIATTAATEFDPADLSQLRFARDMHYDAYQRVFRKLNDIRNKNSEIKFAYIFRPVDDAGMFEFVADADSNFDLPFLMKYDINDTGPFTQENENVYPGMRYFDYTGLFRSALNKPNYNTTIDKWGRIVSGATPILDASNNPVALLGLDVDLGKITR